MAARAPSLRSRLLVTLAALLLVAAAAAAWWLDSLYRDLGLRALEDVLDAQVIALISTAEIDAEGRLVPQNLAEPRLATPGSGLYAEIVGARGSWRSPSSVGSGLDLAARPMPGESRFEHARLADGTRVLGLSLGIRWEPEQGDPRDFVLRAAQSLEPWYEQLLREMGIDVAMLTGDNRGTAERIAGELGMNIVLAEVLPGQKAQEVRKLQAAGKRVGMVGDGVNDAPALTQADVGIAMGAGTDVAIDSADVVLMKSDPLDVVRTIEISRAALRKMHQNLWWAVGYNVIAFPLAAGLLYPVVLSPEIAALAMSGSSVLVAINALLLKRHRLSTGPEPEALPAPA